MASGLGALGSRVPEAKIVEAAEKLVAEMRQREDPYQLSILARGLGALGSRVPADKTAAAAERLVAEMRHRMSLSELSALEISALRRRFPAQLVHGSLSAFLALDRSTLARALGELGSRVPEAAADEAAEILVAEMRQRKDSADLQALGAFAARVSDAKASTLLPDTLDRILAPRLWDCGMVAGLFRRQQTSLILDLMKWPTCSGTDSLTRRIGELENVSFEDQQHRIDQQRFQDWLKLWAAKNNYDLSAPPTPTLKGMRGL
jgi:hypothetical protein